MALVCHASGASSPDYHHRRPLLARPESVAGFTLELPSATLAKHLNTHHASTPCGIDQDTEPTAQAPAAAAVLTSSALRPCTHAALLSAVLFDKHDMLVAVDLMVGGEAEQQHCKGQQGAAAAYGITHQQLVPARHDSKLLTHQALQRRSSLPRKHGVLQEAPRLLMHQVQPSQHSPVTCKQRHDHHAAYCVV